MNKGNVEIVKKGEEIKGNFFVCVFYEKIKSYW